MKGRQLVLRHGHTWKNKETGRPEVSLTYKSWQSMKYRCQKREDYVSRGITVCARWLALFDNFLIDMGERPNADYSIDRIDNDGGYWCGHCQSCKADSRPANCRWATRSEQQQNRRPMPNQPNQYSTGVGIKPPRVNECGHPDRRHEAKGMCSACYQRDWRARS